MLNLSSHRIELNNCYKHLLALTNEPINYKLLDTIEVVLWQAYKIVKSPDISISEYVFLDRATDDVNNCYEYDSAAAKQIIDDLCDGLKLIFARYEKHC